MVIYYAAIFAYERGTQAPLFILFTHLNGRAGMLRGRSRTLWSSGQHGGESVSVETSIHIIIDVSCVPLFEILFDILFVDLYLLMANPSSHFNFPRPHHSRLFHRTRNFNQPN